jgi:hypothetical protein
MTIKNTLNLILEKYTHQSEKYSTKWFTWALDKCHDHKRQKRELAANGSHLYS